MTTETTTPDQEQMHTDPCPGCNALTPHHPYNNAICESCRTETVAALTAAIPRLAHAHEALYGSELDAFLARGELPGVGIMLDWPYRWKGEPFTMADSTIARLTEALTIALMDDYRNNEEGISILAGIPRDDGMPMLDAHAPFVDDSELDEISTPIAATLRPILRDWLTATLPVALRHVQAPSITTYCMEWLRKPRHWYGNGSEEAEAIGEMVDLAQRCGLSDGAADLILLNAWLMIGSAAEHHWWCDPKDWDMDDGDEARRWLRAPGVVETLPEHVRTILHAMAG